MPHRFSTSRRETHIGIEFNRLWVLKHVFSPRRPTSIPRNLVYPVPNPFLRVPYRFRARRGFPRVNMTSSRNNPFQTRLARPDLASPSTRNVNPSYMTLAPDLGVVHPSYSPRPVAGGVTPAGLHQSLSQLYSQHSSNPTIHATLPPTPYTPSMPFPPPQPYPQVPLHQPQLYPQPQPYQPHAQPYYRPFSLAVTKWPDEKLLSYSKGNWQEWSAAVKCHLGLHSGAQRFLSADELPPDSTFYPAAYRQWIDNDVVVKSFLESVCSNAERGEIQDCGTAALAWAKLMERHENRGPLQQIKALKEVFSISYSNDPATFETTLTRIRDLNKTIWAGGPPDAEVFLAALHIGALLANHSSLVDGLLARTDLDIVQVEKSIMGKATTPAEVGKVAFAAMRDSGRPRKDICTVKACRRKETHSSEFCVSEGGGMAGQSVSAAMRAQEAA
ncbi:hypothetical protein C8F01DRAFT_1254082 [Mycena amicta]|nr:hypothetical protein C8F01DRAFT_1254082 [Mycena amicta]